MKHIISGTDRKGSRTFQIAKMIANFYREAGEDVEIIDLANLPTTELTHGVYTQQEFKGALREAIDKVNKSEGLIMVVPEYNGSVPGVLKLFIDHWKYPDSFENRPVAFIGLGGMFGGLRPVEHLQQIFGYRNAFIFPLRVFLMNVPKSLENGRLKDAVSEDLLKKQVVGFQKFVRALMSEKLHANNYKS